MEDLLKQILSELKSTNERLDNVDTRLNNIELKFKEINRESSIIFEQTADLSEFKTTMVDTLSKIESDVEFLTLKETQTENAILNIERKFSADR